MKKYLFIFLVIVCFSSLQATDELWQKAVQIMENSQNLVPGKTTFIMRTTGNLVPSRDQVNVEVVLSHSMGEDGKVVNSVISQRNHAFPADTRSGRTVDKEILDAVLAEDMTPDDSNMFTETDPSKLAVKRIRGSKRIDGMSCVAYDVRYTGDSDEQLRGTVWLDSVSGAPLLVEMRPQNVPQGARADFNMEFKYDPEAETSVCVKVTANIKFGELNQTAIVEQTQLREDFWVYSKDK